MNWADALRLALAFSLISSKRCSVSNAQRHKATAKANGDSLSFWNSDWALKAIIIVQLNYMLSNGRQRGTLRFSLGADTETELLRVAQYCNDSEPSFSEALKFGRYMAYGREIDTELAEAAESYRQAAEEGNARAQCCYGICPEFGIGTKKNIGRAVE
jgi:TPR repeat protein